MAELYRKSALEKISSPEQLDKALTVTSPLSWLALAAVTVMIVITVIWSVGGIAIPGYEGRILEGRIPVTVSTTGVISSPVSTNALYIPESGSVDSVLIHPGSELEIGTPVLSYRTGNGTVRTLYSDQFGTATEIMVKVGDDTKQGSEVARLSPLVSGNQVIVCYIKLDDAKKIERGMEANVFLTSADSQNYGHMRARVVNIDSYVASATGMSYVLGSDNNMAATFQQNGAAVVAATLELYPDGSGSSVSGYYWSNPKGLKVEVSNGTLVQAKIIVEEVRPITKLFAKLNELWGE